MFTLEEFWEDSMLSLMESEAIPYFQIPSQIRQPMVTLNDYLDGLNINPGLIILAVAMIIITLMSLRNKKKTNPSVIQ